MATCKNCQESGWFLTVSKIGPCEACELAVASEAKSVVRVTLESMRIAGSMRTLSTMLSRYRVAIDRCAELLPYERCGIEITTPPPSGMIRNIEGERRDKLLSWVAEELVAARRNPRLPQRPQQRSARSASWESRSTMHGEVLVAGIGRFMPCLR